jgi:hypothetical protein
VMSCVQSTRCPRLCSRCRRSLTGLTAHLPLFHAGVYCQQCCPACAPSRRENEGEAQLLDEEEESK